MEYTLLPQSTRHRVVFVALLVVLFLFLNGCAHRSSGGGAAHLYGPPNQERSISQVNRSIIASAKELIKFRGECKLIELFNSWCEESDLWKAFSAYPIDGRITGVINSSKKCGVFVELPSLEMTGLIPVEPDQLVNYKSNTAIKVKITGFDEEKKYNSITKQMEHVEPYVIEDGKLVHCNIKPILTIAE